MYSGCFFIFSSDFSQVQLRKPGYTCMQCIKTEALANASAGAQRDREQDSSWQRSNSPRLMPGAQHPTLRNVRCKTSCRAYDVGVNRDRRFSPLYFTVESEKYHVTNAFQSRVCHCSLMPYALVRATLSYGRSIGQQWPGSPGPDERKRVYTRSLPQNLCQEIPQLPSLSPFR